jgi:hypothetical protein
MYKNVNLAIIPNKNAIKIVFTTLKLISLKLLNASKICL